jgi:hypothetical protein
MNENQQSGEVPESEEELFNQILNDERNEASNKNR